MKPESIKGNRNLLMEDLKKLADHYSHLTFCGQISDPIFHPQFLEILEYLYENGNVVYVHTTGHNSDMEFWKKAFQYSNTRWVFGLDGWPDDSPIHRVGQNGHACWEAMKLGASMGVRVTWQFILFNYNEHYLEDAEAEAEKHGIIFNSLKSTRYHYEGVPDLTPSEEGMKKCIDQNVRSRSRTTQ